MELVRERNEKYKNNSYFYQPQLWVKSQDLLVSLSVVNNQSNRRGNMNLKPYVTLKIIMLLTVLTAQQIYWLFEVDSYWTVFLFVIHIMVCWDYLLTAQFCFNGCSDNDISYLVLKIISQFSTNNREKNRPIYNR